MTDLKLSNFKALPANFKFFLCALHHHPDLWTNGLSIKIFFELEGHKSWYISNIIAHVQSLKDIHHLWAKNVISFSTSICTETIEYPLDSKQSLILLLMQQMLTKRKQYYQSLKTVNAAFECESEHDCEQQLDYQEISPDICNDDGEQNLNNAIQGNEWQQYLLLVGEPGTGKSHALKEAIKKFSANNCKILVATPTGYLATEYKDCFPDDIESDTIHPSFHYRVSQTAKPTYNWNLSMYDIIIIDELSMVPIKIFQTHSCHHK